MSFHNTNNDEYKIRRCTHMCHDTGPDSGLNVWVESCPVCGCVNAKYIEGAQCCFSCYQYPCACGENNNVNPVGDLGDGLAGLLNMLKKPRR